MRKLVVFMHVSLDGFVAGPNGEMDWINIDDAMFEYVGKKIHKTDTALYGRVTYELMQSYWPTAADQPNAKKHTIKHAAWYKEAKKIVLSRTMKGQDLPNTTIISDNIAEIKKIKAVPGKEILIFGSPSASHTLVQENLVDNYWLLVNPVLIGEGIPLFKDIKDRIKLKLLETHTFSSGVICLQYGKVEG